ncbi:MAG TPA: sigma-70 family RNA polymerase sigma factor [Polyangia bacterium]|nr:sigma-70 family RNA polymerase sigma factor [Polyangia bacterium]
MLRVHAGGETRVALDVEELYLRYGPAVLRRCRSILRDPNAAEDVAQEVFVSALRFEARLHDEAPGALLLRMATNLSLNRLRGNRRRPEDADPDVATRIAHSGDDGASAESRAVARNLLARLFRPDDPLAASTQTLAFMHLVDGMTLEEVARETRLSVSGVRKRLRTLRGRLVELQEDGLQ